MNGLVKVAGFVVAIAGVFGAAALVGSTVGPTDADEPATHDMATDEHGAEHGGGHDETVATGLTTSQGGYTLRLAADRARPGRAPLSFTVTGPDGHAVTDYDVQHEKRLHLIVVRRDATGFQHVHPELATDGTWSVAVDLTPGPWRVLADFKPTAGEALTLGSDLLVPGDFEPAASRADSRTATVDDYTVTLDGDLVAEGEAVLTPRVTLDGRDVTDQLQPYLGALGHLVALRRGDLAYLHVHPEGLDFHTSVPTVGTYELFLDFKHAGVVHTAAFTLTAPESGHAH